MEDQAALIDKSSPDDNVSNVQTSQPGRVVIESGVRLQVYGRRWYILLLFSLMAGLQALVYNTFQPISRTALVAFSWTQTDITLIANWGAVGFFLFIALSSWIIEAKGLRVACLLGMLFIALGSALRCVTSHPPWVRWLMHAGQLCNGLGSPVSTAAPPVLSTLWFPPNQRTTATALATLSKFAVLALSFIISPLVIPEVRFTNCTAQVMESFTDTPLAVDNTSVYCVNGSQIPVPPVAELQSDIMTLMYYEAGVCGVVLLLMVLYFPRRPPLPPCVSAATRRVGFLQGVKQLRSFHTGACELHGTFKKLFCMFLVSGGVSAAWVGTMSLNLKPTGVTEKQAGWIGFFSFTAMCLCLLLTARLGDMYPRYMKWFISGLSFTSTVCFLPPTLFCSKLIHLSLPTLTVLVVMGVVAGGCTIPLFYELGCELTYPVGEGTANGILTLFNHIGVILCLSTLVIPQIGIGWLNWGVVAAFGVTSPAVLLIKERHLRLEVDKLCKTDTKQIIDPSLS